MSLNGPVGLSQWVKENFVAAWVDLTNDPDAGKSNKHKPVDQAIPLTRGIGKSNVQTLILTPDGRVLHAMSGYVAPKDFRWELEEALKSWNAVKKTEALSENEALPKKILVGRQHKIQTIWDKEHTKKGQRSWSRHTVAGDRAFVIENPLLPVGAFRTRMLTKGPGGHFGYTSGSGGGAVTTPGQVRQTPFQQRYEERRRKAGVPNVRPRVNRPNLRDDR